MSGSALESTAAADITTANPEPGLKAVLPGPATATRGGNWSACYCAADDQCLPGKRGPPKNAKQRHAS